MFPSLSEWVSLRLFSTGKTQLSKILIFRLRFILLFKICVFAQKAFHEFQILSLISLSMLLSNLVACPKYLYSSTLSIFVPSIQNSRCPSGLSINFVLDRFIVKPYFSPDFSSFAICTVLLGFLQLEQCCLWTYNYFDFCLPSVAPSSSNLGSWRFVLIHNWIDLRIRSRYIN